MYQKLFIFIFLFFIPVVLASAAESPNAEQLFKKKCSLCHGIDKKILGPAVNTMSNNTKFLHNVISKGKNSMPAYEGKLTKNEIKVLVEYLLSNQ